MNKVERMANMTKSIMLAANLYPTDKAAIAYAIESQELFDVYFDEGTTFKNRKELLIDWMMKPNHDIHFKTIDGRFSITLVEGKYDFLYIYHSPDQAVGLASEVMEEVKTCKVAIAKMKKVVKKDEDINVDALKNTINNLRDRNGELIGTMYEKNNEIKDSNNEIAILKKMLMDAKFEIENLKKTNEDLMIYKELVEDDYAEAV